MINWMIGSWATFLFEVKRSLTLQRMSVSMVLIAFPPAISLIIFSIRTQIPIPFEIFITLAVSIICLLSLLLWATPNVYSELEGKSWSFVSSRPGGRVSNFIGKYIVSVFYAVVVSITALTISVFMASRFVGLRNVVDFWTVMVGIFVFASLTYGAIFSLMGTIFIRRAMVVGAGFIILFEVIGATLPVVLSRFTARFHLQSLGIAWNDPKLLPLGPKEYQTYYGMVPEPWFHLACLTGITLTCLIAGCWIIVNREYVTSDEA